MKNKKKIIMITILFIVTIIVISCFFIIVKALNEYDWSRNININLNNGSSSAIYWNTKVDRDGDIYSEGTWLPGMGIDAYVKDREGSYNTVSRYDDNEEPREGSFYEHADFVGVTPYIVIESISRYGFNFSGWDTNTSYELIDNKYYFEAGCYAAGSGDIYLNAQWNPWEHTVFFNGNSDNISNVPDSFVKIYGQQKLLSSMKPTRNNYSFSGWNENADGSGKWWYPSDNYTPDYNGGSVTLYAQWKRIQSTVTFNLNGGSMWDSSSNSYKTNTFSNTDFSGNKSTIYKTPTKEGYTFQGWTISSNHFIFSLYNGSGYQYNYTSDTNFYYFYGNYDCTLTARWKSPVTATFMLNGGSMVDKDVGNTLTGNVILNGKEYTDSHIFSPPTKDGYDFVEWEQVSAEDDCMFYKFNPYASSDWEKEYDIYSDWYITYGYSWAVYRAIWNPNPNKPVANYTVNYYLMNTDGETYSLKESNTCSGNIGASVTPTVKQFEGYISPYSVSTTITIDGSAKVDYYYKIPKVTLNLDGGKILNMNTSSYINNMFTISLPINNNSNNYKKPEKEGYVFEGWNRSNNTIPFNMYTENYQPYNSWDEWLYWEQPTENITLTAVWSKLTTVTFDLDLDGTMWDISSQKTLINGATVTDKVGFDSNFYNNPIRTGYDFAGWTRSFTLQMYDDYGDYYYYKTDSSFYFEFPRENVTLTANWIKKDFNITFDAQGGYVFPTMKTISFGDSYGILPTPTRVGYIFNAWGTKPIITNWVYGIDYLWGNNFNNIAKYKLTQNQTLYAQWKKLYKTTVNLNGGKIAGTQSSNTEITGIFSISNLDGIGTPLYKTPTKDGYIFDGFDMTQSVTLMNENENIYNYKTDTWFLWKQPSFDVTFTARWIKMSTVTFNLDGGSMWDLESGENRTGIYSYTDKMGVNSHAYSNPIKDGYVFAGWQKSSVLNLLVPFGSVMYDYQSNTEFYFKYPSYDVTLTSKWTIINAPYTVNYYLMNTDGITYTLKESSSISGLIGSNVIAPLKSYDGFKNPLQKSITITNDGKATVNYYYARIKYILTIDANQGIYKGVQISKISQFYQSRLNIFIPVRNGYKFISWTLSGAGYFTDFEYVYGLGNGTLTASWNPIKYMILFNSNGGNGSMDDLNCDYDKIYELPANSFTRAGYAFVNWNTKADGTGTSYTDNQEIKNLTDINDTKVTLYAQWKDITPPVISILGSQIISDIETLEGINSVQLNISVIDNESGMKSLKICELNTHTDLEGRDVSSDFATSLNSIKGYITDKGMHYYKVTALDNAGNISTRVFVVNILDINATIINLNNTGATSFLRADRGLLKITLYGYIEKLDITFPDPFATESFNPSIKADLTPKVVNTYDLEFIIPLDNVPDGNYTVAIKGIKGDKVLYTYPEITVNGSVLNQIKNTIKTYPNTNWNLLN